MSRLLYSSIFLLISFGFQTITPYANTIKLTMQGQSGGLVNKRTLSLTYKKT